MKELIINSAKHGKHVVFLDDEDYEKVSLNKWCLQRAKYGFYAARYIWLKLEKKYVYLLMHRVIMNTSPTQMTDHKDRNGLNNQRNNLRICTISENNRNTKMRKHNQNGYKGVESTGIKYSARITFDKKRIRIGSYNSAVEAAKAYNDAAKKYHGEFANLNILE